MQPILEVKNLAKHFGNLVAVKDISFSIAPGVCFGLLGPNGAGKTTTIEMIEGITEPTSGEILYRGKPRDRHFSLQAGIQFQSTSVMERLSTQEILTLFHSLYPNVLPLSEIIEMCGLQGFLSQMATRLSGGQKQRLMFALALINNPDIIFLDEPTTGLDPQSRRNLWKLIERIKGQGKNVVLTTHYMDEAELLCDYLVIVDHGSIIAEGSPKFLLDKHFDCQYVALSKEAFEPLRESYPEPFEEYSEFVEIHSQSVEKTLNTLIEKGVKLHSLKVRTPTLEDLFLKLTGHHLRD